MISSMWNVSAHVFFFFFFTLVVNVKRCDYKNRTFEAWNEASLIHSVSERHRKALQWKERLTNMSERTYCHFNNLEQLFSFPFFFFFTSENHVIAVISQRKRTAPQYKLILQSDFVANYWLHLLLNFSRLCRQSAFVSVSLSVLVRERERERVRERGWCASMRTAARFRPTQVF